MGGEDGRDVDMTLAAEGNGEAGLPLVEVGDNGAVELARDVLGGACQSRSTFASRAAWRGSEA